MAVSGHSAQPKQSATTGRPTHPRQPRQADDAQLSNTRDTSASQQNGRLNYLSATPREAKVLRMRFGIEMNADHTLEEVGKQFDVTRERIRQIEAKALRKLRHPSRSEQLRSFLD